MRSRRLLAALLLLLLATCKSREKAVAELDARVNGEVARLETALRTLDRTQLPAPVAELTGSYAESFARIRGTKSPMLRLYRLRDTFIGIETLAYMAANRKAGDDVASLKALAEGRRAAFAPKREPAGGPVLFRALVEQASNRARKLHVASAPYGAIGDEVWGGLYYLAEGEGNLKFREFVASLPKEVAPDDEPRAERERLLAAADRLQSETVAAFGQDPVSRSTSPASAKLKEARELLAANLLDGATLALVETRLALSRRKAEADPGSIEGAKPAAPAADAIESIPALLQSYVREGTPPVNAVVDREVIPFYASLLQPLKARKVATPAAVTVTLVRWPYT